MQQPSEPQGRCLVDKGSDSGFVGFAAGPVGLTVRLPFVYETNLQLISSSRAEYFRVCALLSRVLQRYAAERVSSPGEAPGSGAYGGPGELIGSPDLAAGIAAAAQLLSEYLREGLINRRKEVRDQKSSNGTPDWPRTLRLAIPVLSEDVPLYPTPVRRRRARTLDDDFVRLHATVVEDAASLFGVNVDLPEESLLGLSEYEAIKTRSRSYLRTIGGRLFRDQERRTLRLIEQYLAFRGARSQDAYDTWTPLLGVNKFEMVWEAIMRSLLGNRTGYDLARLPAGHWCTPAQHQAQIGIRPRVDFARARNGAGDSNAGSYFCLFDAKYMARPEWNQRWAGESDIYKQVLYWSLTGPPRQFDQQMNALIFPETNPGAASVLRVKGLHYWPGFPGSEVFEISGDFERLANAYVIGRFDTERAIHSMLGEATQLARTNRKSVV